MKYEVIPKEYFLENLANYNMDKVRTAIRMLMRYYSLEEIRNAGQVPFSDIVEEGEHSEVMYDIFMYFADTTEYRPENPDSREAFVNAVMKGMFVSGFFG